MSLNFPPSPAPGDTFTSQGVTFVWTGTVWVIPPAGLRFATEAEARAGVREDLGMSPLRGAQAIDEFDVPPGVVAPPAAICIATCIFNGQSGAIIEAKNIVSVAGANTGRYTLTFGTPLPDIDYMVFGSSVGITNHPLLEVSQQRGNSTGASFEIQVGTTGGNLTTQLGFLVASPLVHVAVFR